MSKNQKLKCPNGAMRFLMTMPVEWHRRCKRAAEENGKSLTLLLNEFVIDSYERGNRKSENFSTTEKTSEEP
jgi:hypothetical protein